MLRHRPGDHTPDDGPRRLIPRGPSPALAERETAAAGAARSVAVDKASVLRRRGVLTVRPKVAADLLGTSELQLRRFRKQQPGRLVAVPQGKRAIGYRLDDIERMARDGWRIT